MHVLLIALFLFSKIKNVSGQELPSLGNKIFQDVVGQVVQNTDVGPEDIAAITSKAADMTNEALANLGDKINEAVLVVEDPTFMPSESPTLSPTFNPTSSPTDSPTDSPTLSPTMYPSMFPTKAPQDTFIDKVKGAFNDVKENVKDTVGGLIGEEGEGGN